MLTTNRLTLLTGALACLALLAAFGCKTTHETAGDGRSAEAPSPLAAQLRGPAPDTRPSEKTIELALSEYRWDEWKQLPMALQLDESQKQAWDKLTDAWSARKEAGEDWAKIRADLLSNLSADQQRYWVRYVLYRSARNRLRKQELSEAQHQKLWQAAGAPAQKLYKANVLQTDPYMKNISDEVDRVAAAVQ